MSESDQIDDELTAVVTTGVTVGPAMERSDEERRPAQGDHVGRYVVLSEVGVGGMGVVYRAYDPKLRREVALKCLRGDALDRSAESRLVREAHAMAKLSHPNVVSVYDVEVGPTGIVLAMEFVAGQTLRELARSRPTWQRIVATFVAAGQGLAAAHEAGIIHRDFKPANVLIAEDGRVKVTDFGLAKGIAEPDELIPADSVSRSSVSIEVESLEAPLTRADTVMGTPRYMAPEQHAGRSADARSDQYAFCLALWEALVGRPPFEGEMATLGKRKMEGPPPWPSGRSVPPAIVQAVERGLSVSPRARWPSMRELLDALSVDPARVRRTVSRVAALGFGVGAIIAGFYAWSSWRNSRCAGGEAEFAAVWNEERAQEIQGRFANAPVELERFVWPRVNDALDAYARAWTDEHRAACEATRLRGEQSEAGLERRTSCLTSASVGAGVAVEALASGEPRVLLHADDVLATLRPPTACRDPERVAAATTGASSPSAAQGSARLALAAAVGDVANGIAMAVGMAEGLRDDDPAVAEIHLWWGRLLEIGLQPEEAEPHLRRAMELALEHGPPEVTFAAALGSMEVLGVDLDRRGEADWLAHVALGLARRLDPDGPRNAEVLVSSARIAVEHGEFSRAEADLRTVREIVDGHRDADSTVRPDIDIDAESASLAARRGEVGPARQILERMLSRCADLHGPRHPHRATLLLRFARDLRRGGAPAAAAPFLEEALQLLVPLESSMPMELAEGRHELALAHAQSGDVSTALQELAVSTAALAQAMGPNHPVTLDARRDHADWLARTGDLDEAEKLYRAVRRALADANASRQPRYVDATVALAHVRRDAGHPDDALRLLQEVRSQAEELRSEPRRIEIALSLAEYYAELLAGDAADEDALLPLRRYLEEARALAGARVDDETRQRLSAIEGLLAKR